MLCSTNNNEKQRRTRTAFYKLNIVHSLHLQIFKIVIFVENVLEFLINLPKKYLKNVVFNSLCSVDNKWNIRKAYANNEGYFYLT